MSKGTRTSGYISLFLFFGGLALAGSGWKSSGNGYETNWLTVIFGIGVALSGFYIDSQNRKRKDD